MIPSIKAITASGSTRKIFERNAYYWRVDTAGIGVVGMAPQPYITKNNVGNVPTAYTPGMEWPGSLAYFAEQLFFRQ